MYLKRKELKNAKNYYSQALVIENKKNNTTLKLTLNNKLLEIALKEKDFKKALLYQQKRDSLYSLQTKIDLEEKLILVENQYKLSAKENDLKQIKYINTKNNILLISIASFLLLLSLFLFQRIKNKSLKNEKERIDLEQKILRSQMNPHFIFNVLSAIQNSLLDNEPLKSATYLSQFAQLIRQNFDFIDKKTVLLRDEVNMLQNYVETQKIRFKDKFDFKMNISDDIDINQLKIPPLFLQPFVENSIEHGFKNKKGKGLITITIKEKNESVFYIIEDNGKGFSTKNKDNKLHAVDVFLRRLKLLGNDDEKTFSIKSSTKGTTVKFAIKL